MEKTLTMGELNRLGNELSTKWEKEKEYILLSAKNLYNLIKLKTKIEEEAKILQQTIYEIGVSFGGSIDETGRFQIPSDKVEEMNARLEDLNKESITIQYNPIVVRDENDTISIELMDLLIDFIEITD